jgi:hypothetical protein
MKNYICPISLTAPMRFRRPICLDDTLRHQSMSHTVARHLLLSRQLLFVHIRAGAKSRIKTVENGEHM